MMAKATIIRLLLNAKTWQIGFPARLLGNNQFSGCVPVKVLDMTANYVTSVGLPSC